MFWLLLESALRSLVLGAIVWFGLRVLRVRNPEVELAAWTIVLVAALAMPLLTRIATATIPARMPLPASVVEVMPALPPMLSGTSPLPALLPEPDVAPPSRAATSLPTDWQALAAGAYLTVAGVLLLRVLIGVAMIWRLSRAARPVRETWADGSDVRVCRAVGMPVTFGRIILLPSDYAQWSAIKRQAVLSHERSHVARADYTVLLLGALHRAIFWFNPLSWWLLNRLAALMETASDDAAIEDLCDRRSYAQILIEIAERAGRSPAGAAMARPATVARRVERILSERTLPAKMSWRQRALVAASLLPLSAVAAGAIARTSPAEDQAVIDDPEIASVGDLAAMLPVPLQVDPLETQRLQLQVLPIPVARRTAIPSMQSLPVRHGSLATLANARLPSSPSAPSTDLVTAPGGPTSSKAEEPKPTSDVQPVDMSGSWNMRFPVVLKSPDGRPAWGVPICVFRQDGNQLSGACKIIDWGRGPITGTVNGRHVEWQWNFQFCTLFGMKSARLYSDQFAVTKFRGELDSNNILHGRYQSSMQLGWNRVFFAHAAAPDPMPGCYWDDDPL